MITAYISDDDGWDIQPSCKEEPKKQELEKQDTPVPTATALEKDVIIDAEAKPEKIIPE